MTGEENFKRLCRLTTEVLDLPKDSLSLKSRSSKLQIPRSVVSVIAIMEDDIHPTIIAKIINRHRCSVYHYRDTHKHNYANKEKYRNIFNKVLKLENIKLALKNYHFTVNII